MPAFFEAFPVILVDLGGTVRAESRYSLEQTKDIGSFLGCLLTGAEYSNPAIVKSYTRKAQFGQILLLTKDLILRWRFQDGPKRLVHIWTHSP
jgi:hypothetical protein